MDPVPSPFARAERTFWDVWTYITEAVERFLRPTEPVVTATDHTEPTHTGASETGPGVDHEDRGPDIDQGHGAQVNLDQRHGAQVNLDQGHGAQVNLDQRPGAQVNLDQRHAAQVNLDQRHGAQVNLDQGHGAQVNLDQGHGAQVNLDQRHGAQVNLDQRHGAQVNLDQRHGAQVNLDQRHGAQVNLDQRHGTQVNLDQRHGAQVNLDQRHGAQVNLDQRHGAQVNPDQRPGAQVNLDQRHGAQVNLDQRHGAQVNLDQRHGAQVNIDQRHGAQVNLDQGYGAQLNSGLTLPPHTVSWDQRNLGSGAQREDVQCSVTSTRGGDSPGLNDHLEEEGVGEERDRPTEIEASVPAATSELETGNGEEEGTSVEERRRGGEDGTRVCECDENVNQGDLTGSGVDINAASALARGDGDVERVTNDENSLVHEAEGGFGEGGGGGGGRMETQETEEEEEADMVEGSGVGVMNTDVCRFEEEENGVEVKDGVDAAGLRTDEDGHEGRGGTQDVSEEDVPDGEEGLPDVSEHKDEEDATGGCFRDDGGSLGGLDKRNDLKPLPLCQEASGDQELERTTLVCSSESDGRLQTEHDDGRFASNDEVTGVRDEQVIEEKAERGENEEEEQQTASVVEDESREVEKKPDRRKKTEVIQTLHEEEESKGDEEISSQMCDATEKAVTEDGKEDFERGGEDSEDSYCVTENAVTEPQPEPDIVDIVETTTAEVEDNVSGMEPARTEDGEERPCAGVSIGTSEGSEAEEVPDERTGLGTSSDQMRTVDMEKIIRVLERPWREEEQRVRGVEGALTSTAGETENNRVEMSRELGDPDYSSGDREGLSAPQEPGSLACEESPEEVPEYNNGKGLDGDTTQKILEVVNDGETGAAQEENTEVYGETAEREEYIGSGFESERPLLSGDWEGDGNAEHENTEGSHERSNVGLEGRSETVSHTETKPLWDTEKSDAVPTNRTEIQAAPDLAKARVGLSEEETLGTEAELSKGREEKEFEAESGAGGTVEEKDETLNEVVTEIVDMRTPTISSVDTEAGLSEREPAVDKSSEIEPELQCVTEAGLTEESMETDPPEEVLSGAIGLLLDDTETGLETAEKDAGLQIEAEAGTSEVRAGETVVATETEVEGTLDSEDEKTEGAEVESETENKAEISDRENTGIALSTDGSSENVTPEGRAGIDTEVSCPAELRDETEEKENGLSDKPPETETQQEMTEAGISLDLMESEFRLPEEMVSPDVPLPEHTDETEAEFTEISEDSEDDETEEADDVGLSYETAELETVISGCEAELEVGSPGDADDGPLTKSEESEAEAMADFVEAESGLQEDPDVAVSDVRGPSTLSADINAEQVRDTVEMDVGFAGDIEAVLSKGPEVESPGLGSEAVVVEEVIESDLSEEAVTTGLCDESAEMQTGLLDEFLEDPIQRTRDSGLPNESSDTSGLSKETDTNSADESPDSGTEIAADGLSEVPTEIETGFDETEIEIPDARLASEISQDNEKARLSVKTDVGVPEVTREIEAGLLTVIKAESTGVPEEIEGEGNVLTESLEGEVSSSPVADETVPVQESSEIEALSEEIGGELADEHSEVNVEAGSSPPSRTSTADQDLQLQFDASTLDFTAQKSRIAIKNRLARPPKDPRTLLHMPSLAPTPPKPSPRVPLRGLAGLPPGGIGIKLPGLCAGGFPVLRKTDGGKREIKTENTSEKSETDPEARGESLKDVETQRKPKWTPPRHPGFGNPLMSELKNKLKKTAHDDL